MRKITKKNMNKKSKKSTKKPLKIFLKVFLSIILIFAVVFFSLCISISSGCVGDMEALNLDDIDLNLNLTSQVYYYDSESGTYVEFEPIYGEDNRVWADFEDIPDHVKKAAIAIEDERFYEHSGVDIMSTVKATVGYVFNKSTARGGSTITQQLVKNLTGDSEKSVSRKIQEMGRAIQLEKKLSKDEILELYLNTIYLSQGCSGIQSASKFYFGKNVSELTIAEGACLVGITQYPSLYDPIINPDKNKEKQKLVLQKMYELGYISESEYNESLAEELVFVADGSSGISKQSYFVDQIIEDVLNDLQSEYGYTEAVAANILYNGGLKIYSTVDPEIQRIAEGVFSNKENLNNLTGTTTEPQASMCIMDPYTGQVKAIIGGFGEKEGSRTKNRATDTKLFTRQPGSTIKPLSVYAPALEQSLIKPDSVFEDKQITIGSWTPKNHYNHYKGKMTVKYAIDQSVNTVPVQILQQMENGIDVSYDYLTSKFGISTLTQSDKNLPALALGGLTNGVTNLQLTAAYCTFPNNGKFNSPITYTKVVDSNGNVILEKKSKSTVVVSTNTAKTMNGLLYSVCNSSTGTGTRAKFGGYKIAGKTGSTDSDKDRWFVGYTPYYCAAVWVGYDTNETVKLPAGSTNPALNLWRLVMEEVHSQKNLSTTKTFDYIEINVEEPTNSLDGMICKESGLKATENCPEDSLISSETEIDEYCNIHSTENSEDNSSGTEDGNSPYLSESGL